jgi:reverse gyrase
MAAGAGKTITIFYLAYYYEKEGREVVIVIPNELLQRQV